MKNNKKKRNLILGLILLVGCALILVIVFRYVKSTQENETVDESVNKNESLYLEDIEEFSIKTSYGDLVFPKKWQKYVTTEIEIEDGVETVEFWAELEEKIHVFDIIFGGEGYRIGSLKVADGEEINVYIEAFNYELDENWSEEEETILKSIEYDINYLLENMSRLDNYTSIVE